MKIPCFFSLNRRDPLYVQRWNRSRRKNNHNFEKLATPTRRYLNTNMIQNKMFRRLHKRCHQRFNHRSTLWNDLCNGFFRKGRQEWLPPLHTAKINSYPCHYHDRLIAYLITELSRVPFLFYFRDWHTLVELDWDIQYTQWSFFFFFWENQNCIIARLLKECIQYIVGCLNYVLHMDWLNNLPI